MKLLLLAALLLMSVLLNIFNYKPESNSLNFNFSDEGQQNQNWCYAGATKLVFEYFPLSRNKKNQVDIVNDLVKRTDCGAYNTCLNGNAVENSVCNWALNSSSKLDWANYLTSNTGQKYSVKTFDYKLIKNAIKNKKGPVILNFGQAGNFKHSGVISAYFVLNQRFNLSFKDFGWKDKTIIFHVINPGTSTCSNCKKIMFFDVETNDIKSQITSQDKKYFLTTEVDSNASTSEKVDMLIPE